MDKPKPNSQDNSNLTKDSQLMDTKLKDFIQNIYHKSNYHRTQMVNTNSTDSPNLIIEQNHKFTNNLIQKSPIDSNPNPGIEDIVKKTNFNRKTNDVNHNKLTEIAYKFIVQSKSIGIDQYKWNDCWFEATVASLASTLQGKKSLTNMIVQNPDNSYTVTFPGDETQPIQVTKAEIKKDKLTNQPLWANILEAAAIKRFPAEAVNGTYPTVGLALLTGAKTSFKMLPSKMSTEQINNLENYINTALKNQYPILAASRGLTTDKITTGIVPGHLYTIMKFNPETKEIIVRNPWGNNYETNKNLPKIGQKKNGITNIGNGDVTMNIDTFSRQFVEVATLNSNSPILKNDNHQP